MSRARLPAVAVVLLSLVPASARARILVSIPDVIGTSPGTFTADVFARGTDDENEQLFAYDLGFTLRPETVGQSGGVRLVAPYARKPASDFVFGDQPTEFSVANQPAPTDTSVIVNVVDDGALVDLTSTPVKLATVVLQLDPAAPDSVYRLGFDLRYTDFASGDPSRVDPTIQADFVTALLTVPEPGAGALAVVAGAMVLRRRRT